MKILKNSTIKEEVTSKEIKCPYCKSLLLIEKEDYHSGYIWFSNEVGQLERGYFNDIITCPCCNKEFRP